MTPAHPNEPLRQFLAGHDAVPNDEQIVFVGEAEDAIQHPEADSDRHEAANLDLSLEQFELHKLWHVHAKAATITIVTAWPKKRVGVDPNAGAELMLALRPGEIRPRPDEHPVDLQAAGSSELSFDLVREVTPKGYQQW